MTNCQLDLLDGIQQRHALRSSCAIRAISRCRRQINLSSTRHPRAPLMPKHHDHDQFQDT
jgi:hypothetical protein